MPRIYIGNLAKGKQIHREQENREMEPQQLYSRFFKHYGINMFVG
jgi:hypothetical protein